MGSWTTGSRARTWNVIIQQDSACPKKNTSLRILWGFKIQTDHQTTDRRKDLVWQYPPADPTISWPVIHLVVFLISGRGYFTFFTDTESTTERVEEKNKRTNTDLGQLQAQESGVCETFLSLEISTLLFSFTFLFSNDCCSLDYCVICVVSGLCNQHSLLFFKLCSRHRIESLTLSSMLARPLPASFLDILSMSYLACKALCIIINFLVFCSVCWRSSLVYFRNGPEYLTRGTTQEFIRLMRFLLYSFSFEFSRFPVVFFPLFFHLLLYDDVYFQYFQVLVSFLFSKHSYFFLIW